MPNPQSGKNALKEELRNLPTQRKLLGESYEATRKRLIELIGEEPYAPEGESDENQMSGIARR